MQLHQLDFKQRGSRRIGRGGKRGTYSGRGIKGQRSRTGARIRPAIRDLIKRIPKARGYEFKTIYSETAVIALRELNRAAQPGDLVTFAYLRRKGLMGPQKFVKIVATGTLDKKITVKGCPVSAGAKVLIEKAGGRVLKTDERA